MPYARHLPAIGWRSVMLSTRRPEAGFADRIPGTHNGASMRARLCLLVLVSLTVVSSGQTPAPQPPASSETPLKDFPYTPSLDPTAMDRSANPCADFYQYSCGGWRQNNPIPPDQARWSVYSKLADNNRRYLWGVLQDTSDSSKARDAVTAQIGDYFAACMDAATVDKLGLGPLKPEVDAI